MTDQPIASGSPRTVAEHEQAVIDEYSAYTAAQTIYVDGALAFNVGDPVPRTHVDTGVVPESMVTPVKTRSAKSTGQKET